MTGRALRPEEVIAVMDYDSLINYLGNNLPSCLKIKSIEVINPRIPYNFRRLDFKIALQDDRYFVMSIPANAQLSDTYIGIKNTIQRKLREVKK